MTRVYIDPGHGGEDSGIIYDNLIEKNIVLNIALNCKNMLVENDIEVKLSRESDIDVDIDSRINESSEFGADYYVSIHCNEGHGDRGEIVYSCNEREGLKLARKVGDEMNRVGQRAVKIYNVLDNDGEDHYEVIRDTSMSSIIIDCAYLDHGINSMLVDGEEKQKEFGQAIATAIIKQVNENK